MDDRIHGIILVVLTLFVASVFGIGIALGKQAGVEEAKQIHTVERCK
jgi:hypothetical protein